MNRIPFLSAVAPALLMAALPVQAQIYRCVGPDGKVEFRNMTCPPTAVTAGAYVRPDLVAGSAARPSAAEKPGGERPRDGESKRREPGTSVPAARP